MSDLEILELSYKQPTQFAELFNRHSGRFLAIARKMTHSKDESDDIVQETFVRVYKHGKKFLENESGKKNFKQWSNAILKNCILDQIRKRRTKEIPLSEEIVSVVAVESDAEVRESTNYVRSILGRIDRGASEILNLHYMLGKSFKEIGKLLGISSAAARVRAHRAKKEFVEMHKSFDKPLYKTLN
ncbi:MAG TPA: sigma-70 family RNA polymerase sigma factor [Candidatus Paceibacterota bacterium]